MKIMKLTQQMKSHAVIVALLAEHSDLEIARFLKVERSFVKVWKPLTGILQKYPKVKRLLSALITSEYQN